MLGKEVLAGFGKVQDGIQGLAHFVGNPSHHLSHCVQSGYVRQLLAMLLQFHLALTTVREILPDADQLTHSAIGRPIERPATELKPSPIAIGAP